jgi:site-specific recombinase XerD
MEDAAVKWIEASRGLIADNTLTTYAQYFSSHLVDAFPSLLDVTPSSVKEYITKRLAVVRAQSVRKELSALRGVTAWAAETGLIAEQPLIPGIAKKVQGTAWSKKRRSKAGRLEVEEIEAFLAALPVTVAKIGFVQARFVLQYEMALRPSLVDRLSAPEHWYPGSKYLTLDASSMKARTESEKLLTHRAKQALEDSYRGPGLIYGCHDYRLVVAEAALVLPPEKAATFTTAHLRSAGLTHLVDQGASLAEVQAHADHKLASTTDRYLRSSKKSLEAFLVRRGRA